MGSCRFACRGSAYICYTCWKNCCAYRDCDAGLPQIATCGLVCVYCKEKERIEEARKKEAEAAEQRRKELYRNRLEATLNSIIEQVKGGVYDKAKLLKDLIHAVDLSIEDEDENKESY